VGDELAVRRNGCKERHHGEEFGHSPKIEIPVPNCYL
jgi:hypothetical protein